MGTQNKQLLWMRNITRGMAVFLTASWLVGGMYPATQYWSHNPGYEALIFILPGFLLLVGTSVAWRWETVGGSLLILVSLSYLYLFLHQLNKENSNILIVIMLLLWMIPVLIVGFSFVACGRQLKKT